MAVFSQSLVLEKANLPKIKKALHRLHSGTGEETIASTGFLIRELSRQAATPEVQEIMKQLINRLIRDSHSICVSIRDRAIKELGKLINELVKSKDLEGLRYVARASYFSDNRNKALKELVRFEDLKGLRYIAQWGRFRDIRNKSVAELAKFKDTEGLRFVAQWNMYRDTANRAVKELEKLTEKLVRFKDRDGLKCLIIFSKDREAQRKAIDGLEKLLDELIKSKDLDSLRYVAALGSNRIKRNRAVEEINDLKSLKYVVRSTKGVYKDTCLKAVQELEKYIDEMMKTKDREGLEYLAEFSSNESIWKQAIEEIHKIREVSQEDKVTESLQKILLPRKIGGE
ncbi:MAG: hypothetical protein AB1422_00815 [bacterium]